MFTGLIKDVGTVLEKRMTTTAATLKIASKISDTLQLGDSMAVNGVCLTASRLEAGWFRADVMPETWRSTNLAELKPGGRVNLEPALAMGAPLGGHLVSGHVEGIGRIRRIERQNNAILVGIGFPKELADFIVHKGSVAVNGISLTIQAVTGLEFLISLIPHTFAETNFPFLKVGDPVNLETDLMAKYVLKTGKSADSRITEEFLAEHGFM